MGKLVISTSVPQIGTAAWLQALPDLLHTTPLTSICHNTPIDPATVIYYNCRENGYFISLYLEPKNTGNIKEIKEIKKDISKELKKEEF